MMTRNHGSVSGASKGATSRRTFAKRARAAIEKHVPESRSASATWREGVNDVWVRWPISKERYALLGLHRHMNWLTGEAGLATGPHALRELAMIPAGAERVGLAGPALAKGCRARLGVILEGDDRWWSAGRGERALTERLEWIVLQLRAHAPHMLERWLTGRPAVDSKGA